MNDREQLIHEYAKVIGAYIDAQTAFLVHRDEPSLFALFAAESARDRMRRLLEESD